MLTRVNHAECTLRSCEICGSAGSSAIPAYSRNQWPVVECDDCRFVFLAAVPSYDALVKEFAWEKTFEVEKKRRRRSRFGWLDSATRWRTKVGHLIDRQRRRRTLGTNRERPRRGLRRRLPHPRRTDTLRN